MTSELHDPDPEPQPYDLLNLGKADLRIGAETRALNTMDRYGCGAVGSTIATCRTLLYLVQNWWSEDRTRILFELIKHNEPREQDSWDFLKEVFAKCENTGPEEQFLFKLLQKGQVRNPRNNPSNLRTNKESIINLLENDPLFGIKVDAANLIAAGKKSLVPELREKSVDIKGLFSDMDALIKVIIEKMMKQMAKKHNLSINIPKISHLDENGALKALENICATLETLRSILIKMHDQGKINFRLKKQLHLQGLTKQKLESISIESLRKRLKGIIQSED